MKYSPEKKQEILNAYHERSSLRGLERTFGISRQTVSNGKPIKLLNDGTIHYANGLVDLCVKHFHFPNQKNIMKSLLNYIFLRTP